MAYDDISDDINQKLKKALNACIRFIYDLPRTEHITQYRNKADLLNVTSRRQYFMGNLLYSVLNNKIQQYLYNFFDFNKLDESSHNRL